MYLYTLSISDFETEKAEADSCHPNKPCVNLLALINFEELSAKIVARASSGSLGERETRKWICSEFA
jgi:hypothetical protein